MLHIIENLDQIIDNIKTIETYLNSSVKEEKQFAVDLVRRGRTILVYRVNGKNHFAPGRFLGYKKNTINSYNEKAMDTTPNAVITKLMGKPFSHAAIEKEYMEYAATLTKDIPKNTRKYWRVRNEDNKYFELETEPAVAQGKE